MSTEGSGTPTTRPETGTPGYRGRPEDGDDLWLYIIRAPLNGSSGSASYEHIQRWACDIFRFLATVVYQVQIECQYSMQGANRVGIGVKQQTLCASV